MLPFDTREQIREAIARGVTPGQSAQGNGFVVGIPIDHPDPEVSHLGVQPALRWPYQDIENREEPYQEVILRTGTTGIIESDAPADLSRGRYLATEDISEGPQDAHVRDTYGRPAYDELVLQVVAVGQLSTAILGEQVTVSDTKLAGTITDAIHDFLTDRWKTRPVDEFDRNGNLVDHDHLIYADELPIPVLPKPDPTRGPSNVTDQVDRDDGSQWDAQMNLHYFDTSQRYALSPTRGEADTQIDTDTTTDR